MAKDSPITPFEATAYVANTLGHPAAPYGLGRRAGSGSPEGSVNGWPGDHYWDYTNNTVYFKDSSGFGSSGWVEVVGGVGSGDNNQNGSGSPVGVATPDYVGQFYLDTDTPLAIWISNGLTSADWIEVLGNL
jgi:hypothetical protein